MANKNDAMAYHLKTRLEDIAVNVCLQNCATFHKSTGDGLLATFTDSVSAANAAKDILRDIDVRNSHTVNPVIDVRLSLHHGSTYKLNTGSQDLHGNDINIAFRIECLRTENFAVIEKEFPDRNRVLCSDDFVWEVRTKFPQCGLTFAYCGEAFLKGIRDTKSIFLLDASSPM
jgi:class 3 adenylate cyclase